jgi:hypothetical protein
MGGLEPPTQPPRVRAANNILLTTQSQFAWPSLLGSQTLARWVAWSSQAMVK